MNFATGKIPLMNDFENAKVNVLYDSCKDPAIEL
jgi:hypothetical protein